MAMTKSQAINLANYVRGIRPEWDFHGVMAALAKLANLDSVEAGQTALAAAGDAAARTPAAMTNGVYRPSWQPATADQSDYARQVRSQQVAHRTVLDQVRRDAAQADPDSSHRGYTAATRALRSHA